MKTIKAPKSKKPKLPKMVDVADGVRGFLEVVVAADELEAFMGKHSSVDAIHIGITEHGIALEFEKLINKLQRSLQPYRDAVKAGELARN